MEGVWMAEPLSPAAQAVLDAFENASDGEYVEGVWVVNERTMLSAALRAAADQVEDLDVPRNYEGDSYWIYEEGQDAAAGCLRAIAAELEGGNG